MHADEPSDHLANVRDVLELLGYTPTNTPADANLIWAWRDPFTKKDPEEHPKLAAVHAHLRNLQVWYRWCSTELAENAQRSPTPIGGREAQLGARGKRREEKHGQLPNHANPKSKTKSKQPPDT